MLSSSGPANMAGNNVSTSIFILLPAAILEHWAWAAPVLVSLACRVFFYDFQGAAQTAVGAARQQQRPNGVNGHALAANYLADILRMEAQFINRRAFALDGCDSYSVRMLHKSFDDVFEKGLHGGFPYAAVASAGAAAAAAFDAFFMKLATVSLGWAPLPSQYFARSRSSL